MLGKIRHYLLHNRTRILKIFWDSEVCVQNYIQRILYRHAKIATSNKRTLRCVLHQWSKRLLHRIWKPACSFILRSLPQLMRLCLIWLLNLGSVTEIWLSNFTFCTVMIVHRFYIFHTACEVSHHNFTVSNCSLIISSCCEYKRPGPQTSPILHTDSYWGTLLLIGMFSDAYF